MQASERHLSLGARQLHVEQAAFQPLVDRKEVQAVHPALEQDVELVPEVILWPLASVDGLAVAALGGVEHQVPIAPADGRAHQSTNFSSKNY